MRASIKKYSRPFDVTFPEVNFNVGQSTQSNTKYKNANSSRNKVHWSGTAKAQIPVPANLLVLQTTLTQLGTLKIINNLFSDWSVLIFIPFQKGPLFKRSSPEGFQDERADAGHVREQHGPHYARLPISIPKAKILVSNHFLYLWQELMFGLMYWQVIKLRTLQSSGCVHWR